METDSPMEYVPFLFQPASRQVWVQAIARALYQAGHGSIHFFTPLIFVNQVGLSATAVGIGMGSGALGGIVGHFLGGYLADSPAYGRKRALLFSAAISIMAAIALAVSESLPMLIVGNLLLGLSSGCYWTAADAAVIDVTNSEHHHKAFAVLVLADSLGGVLGIWGGAMLLSLVERAQNLFFVGSLILVVFLLLILIAVTETRQEHLEHVETLQGFVMALRDRSLLLFIGVNVLFTTYLALVNSTLPLYFTNVVSINPEATLASRTSIASIANLFTWWYIGLGALLQVPIVQVLGCVPKVQVLGISMLLWGTGFILVWVSGTIAFMPIVWAIASLSVLSIAATIYKPFAPAIVAELAPKSLRGVYLAISYQCWSIGYFVGPVLGGWAMDQSGLIARGLWVVATIGAFFSLFILNFLSQSRVSNSVASIEDTASILQ